MLTTGTSHCGAGRDAYGRGGRAARRLSYSSRARTITRDAMKGMFAIASLAGLLLVAVATSGSGSLRAVASQGCTNHSLRGAYGYQGTGTIYQAGQEVGDFAAAGRVVFDGNGNLQGKQEGTNVGSPSV